MDIERVHGRRVESENEETVEDQALQPNYDCIREVFERSTNGAK